MEKSRITEAKMAFVLKPVEDGTSIAGVCRKAGIAEPTFCNWRKNHAGSLPSEMKRLKMPDEENTRPKRLVADLSLDKAMLQDAIKRKLQSLRGAGNRLLASGRLGRQHSSRMRCSSGASLAIIPGRMATDRPGPRRASRKPRRRVCATDTGASASCCDGRVGT